MCRQVTLRCQWTHAWGPQICSDGGDSLGDPEIQAWIRGVTLVELLRELWGNKKSLPIPSFSSMNMHENYLGPILEILAG